MPSTRKASIQDIANALGLSRNTVSKALNGQPGITEATRQRILEQAREMNYKSMGDMSVASQALPQRDILLMCSDAHLSPLSFFSVLIQALNIEVRRQNATAVVQFLPVQADGHEHVAQAAKNAEGIIAMESLTAPYIHQLLNTGKPVVFFDYHSMYDLDARPCDIVLSDARPVAHILQRMYEKGARSFGFVGNPNHCLGFRTRYEVFQTATAALGAVTDPKFNLPQADSPEDFAGKSLADAYLCANDYVAMPLMRTLAKMGKRIPEDIQVSGFDDVLDASGMHPSLTTVHVAPDALASCLTLLLFDRIANPTQPSRIITPAAQAVFRESTR